MIKIVDVKESFEKKNPISIYDKKKKKKKNQQPWNRDFFNMQF